MGVARWIWEMRLGIIYLLLVLVAFNGTTDFLGEFGTQNREVGSKMLQRDFIELFVFQHCVEG